MTARELSVPESAEQAKARFASWESEPSDDWLYFGTVHHHCSASAFQSSTDEQNEWNQDGLHITVGKMDQERHDLHARFYLGGNCFEPDLSCFWPIGPELAEQVPASLHHHLACHQMGSKVTVDFPDQWRAHLVEGDREQQRSLPIDYWGSDEIKVPAEVRLSDALEEISGRCAILSIQEEEWVSDLHALTAGDVNQVIIAACIKHEVMPEDLLAGFTVEA